MISCTVLFGELFNINYSLKYLSNRIDSTDLFNIITILNCTNIAPWVPYLRVDSIVDSAVRSGSVSKIREAGENPLCGARSTSTGRGCSRVFRVTRRTSNTSSCVSIAISRLSCPTPETAKLQRHQAAVPELACACLSSLTVNPTNLMAVSLGCAVRCGTAVRQMVSDAQFYRGRASLLGRWRQSRQNRFRCKTRWLAWLASEAAARERIILSTRCSWSPEASTR